MKISLPSFFKKIAVFAFFEQTMNVHAEQTGVHPPHPPTYPRSQQNRVNDPTRQWKKSQTENQLSLMREYLLSNSLWQTIIWKVEYNSFFTTYVLRWRHQYIKILKISVHYGLNSRRKILLTNNFHWNVDWHAYYTWQLCKVITLCQFFFLNFWIS